MKKIAFFMSVLFSVLTFMTSCDNEETLGNAGMGYISLNISTLTSTNTRALDKETYNPKQMAVVIRNAEGEIVEQTDDHSTWAEKEIALPEGTYTVTVSSNGFDGKESGFDIPYYAGSAEFTVAKNTSQVVSVTCTLATVKVTVKFSDRFKAVFSEANVRVSSAVRNISPLNFTMSEEYDDKVAGYFPVGNITAQVSVKSLKGSFSSQKTFSNVSARDHIIINYDVAVSGSSQITVTASPNGNSYTYNINVADFNQNIIETKDLGEGKGDADVWTTKATLSASICGVEDFNLANAYFEYKADEEGADFVKVSAENDAAQARVASGVSKIKAELNGLTPGKKYIYRAVYSDGTDSYTTPDYAFTTEAETPLFNGNMDAWYQRPGSGFSRRAQWFACSQEYFNANGTWWDSSNRGTTEGVGYLANKNPTTGSSTVVHTEGGMSAQLASTSAVGVLAAASLYAGTFNSLVGTSGAKLDWGRPFTSRPKALHGWYQYQSGKMDFVNTSSEATAGLVKGESDDLCSAYIALIHVDNPNKNGTAITVNNTDMSTFPDWENDPRIVAYAALPEADGVSTNGEWKEMMLNLNYHRTDLKPTHIIIVFAASKYGDYFTGSTKSILYLDDFDFIY